jgi:hypothetical protein
MTIAERIKNGETAADIGITPAEYKSRKETIDRFLITWTGSDFDADYRAWIKAQEAGDRGSGADETLPEKLKTNGMQIRRVMKKKPCPACGGGKIR